MDIPKYAGKAATVGAVGYAIGSYLQPGTIMELRGGRSVPFNMFAAGATAVGSIASDRMHNQVIPHVLKSERWSSTGGAFLAGGTSVGSIYAVSYLMDECVIREGGIMNSIGFALAAEADGSYLFHSFIEPLMQ